MKSPIKEIIHPRIVPILRDKTVRRILPVHGGHGVGPFLFLDHFGPEEQKPDDNNDIGPHPHIGLETVTYLFEGTMFHRDSLGSEQEIRPGDVNWMTAGKGIVHSERTPENLKTKKFLLHGLQAWVGLPLADELVQPTFHHHPKESLPKFTLGGIDLTLIAGSACGHTSPVHTFSKLFYLETKMPKGKRLDIDTENQETAFYLIEGKLIIDEKKFESPILFIFQNGSILDIFGEEDSFGVLLGGEPLDGGRRHMWWNFVASSKERIEEAKKNWREGKFPLIPGETGYIPLPE